MANKKYRKDGSKSKLQRNTSSQFSNYFERRMSNLAMAKQEAGSPSGNSVRKVIHEVSHFTNNVPGHSQGKDQLLNDEAIARGLVAAQNINSLTDQSPLSRFAMRENSAARKSRQSQPVIKNNQNSR